MLLTPLVSVADSLKIMSHDVKNQREDHDVNIRKINHDENRKFSIVNLNDKEIH